MSTFRRTLAWISPLKVIDFGIAKATSGQSLTDKTLFIAFEQFVGTPAYMSPEQAEMSGSDVDTSQRGIRRTFACVLPPSC